MSTDKIVLLGVLLSAAALVGALGVPLMLGRVPRNRIYGFRTAATIRDPAVWYPVNHVTGVWCIVIGVVTAGVTLGVFFSSLSLPAAALISAGTLVVGVIAMAVHGLILCARLTRKRAA